MSNIPDATAKEVYRRGLQDGALFAVKAMLTAGMIDANTAEIAGEEINSCPSFQTGTAVPSARGWQR